MNNSLTKFKNEYIEEDGEHYGFIIENNKMPTVIYNKLSLHQIQKLVGGNVELVRYVEDDNYDLVVDEEGLIKDKKFNLFAFLITGHYFYGTVVALKKGVLI